MASLTGLIRRAAALAALALSASLGGCVYDSYYYEPARASHGDYYYGEDYYGGDYYGGYGGWYAYDALFWPSWYWYSPYYWPGYYYGVTYAPWFGFSIGYYDWGHHHHGPWGYHHYSPYRGSWWDNYAYYGGTDWRHGHRDRYSGYRFGSARNEAERLARSEGLAGAAQRSRGYGPSAYRGGGGYGAPFGGSSGSSAPGAAQRGNWSRGIDYGDRSANDLEARRAAGARDGDPTWSRYQPAPGRTQPDWRAQSRPGPDTQPQQIDGRSFRGPAQRPSHDRYGRPLDGADAYSRGVQPGLQYETPVPRGEPRYGDGPRPAPGPQQYAAPQPAVQPSSGGYRGGRPESSSRSYDAPSAPSSPRGIDHGGGGGRSDGGSRGDHGRSREPD